MPRPGLVLPQAWSNTKLQGTRRPTPLAAWWQRLEDPQLVATAASFGLSQVMGLPDAFDPTIKLLALLFSAFIGVVFGYFPSRRATQIDPIEALRHEQADDRDRPCEPGRQRTAAVIATVEAAVEPAAEAKTGILVTSASSTPTFRVIGTLPNRPQATSGKACLHRHFLPRKLHAFDLSGRQHCHR